MRTPEELRERINAVNEQIERTPKWLKDQLRSEAAALEWVLRISKLPAFERMNQTIVCEKPLKQIVSRGKGRPKPVA